MMIRDSGLLFGPTCMFAFDNDKKTYF